MRSLLHCHEVIYKKTYYYIFKKNYIYTSAGRYEIPTPQSVVENLVMMDEMVICITFPVCIFI